MVPVSICDCFTLCDAQDGGQELGTTSLVPRPPRFQTQCPRGSHQCHQDADIVHAQVDLAPRDNDCHPSHDHECRHDQQDNRQDEERRSVPGRLAGLQRDDEGAAGHRDGEV